MAMESHLLSPCFVGTVYEAFCNISFLYSAEESRLSFKIHEGTKKLKTTVSKFIFMKK
jgi:hypothetical protein